MLMTLFNAKIVPILTDGSSVWGPKSNNTITGKKNDNFRTTETLQEQIDQRNIKSSIKINEENVKITLENFAAKLKLLSVSSLLGIDVNLSPFYEEYTIHKNVERFYLSFMKTSFGVKKSCTSDELGTYPMFAKIIPKALKFYATMKDCSHNDLIHTIFLTSKLIHSCWAQGIHFFKPNWYEGALEW